MLNQLVPPALFEQVLADGMSELYGGFNEATEDPINNGDKCNNINNSSANCGTINNGGSCATINSGGKCATINSGKPYCSNINTGSVCK